MSNVLLEQYGIHKLKALRESPYACLTDSDIEQTPHQIDAFVSALAVMRERSRYRRCYGRHKDQHQHEGNYHARQFDRPCQRLQALVGR